jgi:hypothetical protein
MAFLFLTGLQLLTAVAATRLPSSIQPARK